MRPKAPPKPSNPPANRASDRAAPRGVEDGEEIGGSVKLPEQAGSVGVQPLRGESEGSPLRLGSREGVADKPARQEGRRTRSLRRPEYRSFAPFASSLRKAA